MRKIKSILSAVMLMFMSGTSLNAQTVTIQPNGAKVTHNEQFYVGESAYITFENGKLVIQPADNKGDKTFFDLGDEATSLTFSSKQVIPVELREIKSLTYGMTSMVAPERLNLSKLGYDNDLTAYYASSVMTSNVNLTPVRVVGKNQAVFLTGEKGWYCIPVDKKASLPKVQNMFQGSLTEAYTVKNTDKIYAFSSSTASFRPVATGVSIPAGKAYLVVPKDVAASLSLNFGDVFDSETAAEEITIFADDITDFYNLAGQKINAATKGIKVAKGKKFLDR